MKKQMIDILACPMDKSYPLELIELDIKEVSFTNKREIDKTSKNSNEPADKKNVLVIVEGILYCEKCSRFYPIEDEIPILLPDELREKEKDIEFLKKWKDNIPEKILKEGNPWHL